MSSAQNGLSPITGTTAVETVLTRATLSQEATLTTAQAQIDGMVSHFVQEATDLRTLASMGTGSLFYRFGRIGTMALAARAPQAASLLQIASYGVGLFSEVAAFEGTQRSLASLSGDSTNANLWRWSGRGGWQEGLGSSLITFGLLKGSGALAREQNVFAQHLFSDLAMVGGHQAAAAFGFLPRPEGSFAEQLLHAEVTNLQLGAGMSLVHHAAPGLSAFERSLDLSLQSSVLPASRNSRRFLPSFSPEFALAEGEIQNAPETNSERDLELPTVYMSQMGDDPNNKGANGTSGPSNGTPRYNTRKTDPGLGVVTPPGGPHQSGPVPVRKTNPPPGDQPPPSRSSSDRSWLAETLGLSGIKRGLMRLAATFTGTLQRPILDALAKIQAGEPVDPALRDLLSNSDFMRAAMQAGANQQSIIESLRALAEERGEDHPSTFTGDISPPSPVAFKRMVDELGVPANHMAAVLNRVFYPLVEIIRYPSFDGELIYISGEEDALRLREYAKLGRPSLGELLFFRRRAVSRNWGLTAASRELRMDVGTLDLIERNIRPPTREELASISRMYNIELGVLQRLSLSTTFSATQTSIFSRGESPLPPPVLPVGHGPALDPETLHKIRLGRYDVLRERIRQNPASITGNEWEEFVSLSDYFKEDSTTQRENASQDVLTGLLNPRGFELLIPRLEKRLTGGRRNSDGKQPTDYILMLDGDLFGQVNKLYGHDNGNLAIKSIGRVLSQAVRHTDHIVRFGGDEFTIWLDNPGDEGLWRVIGTILETMRNTDIPLVGFDPIRLTVSIGVAEVRPLRSPENPREFTGEGAIIDARKRADQALLKAKKNGKNQAQFSD